MTATTETVSPAQFTDLSNQFTELREKFAASETARTAAEERATASEQRVALLETEARTARFREEATHWTGDPEANLARLTKLADRFGEDSDDFREECRERRSFAERVRTEKRIGGSIMEPIGSPLSGDTADPFATEVQRAATEKNIPVERATVVVMNEKPNLYREYQDRMNARLRGVGHPVAAD